MSFESSQAIANAVLYEGYVLYPYRASAAKNRVRWQFGVVAPRGWSERGGPEAWEQQTECLVEAGDNAALELHLRFLQVQVKAVQRALPGDAYEGVETLWVDGVEHITFEEAVEAQRELRLPIDDLLAGEIRVTVAVDGATEEPEPIVDANGAVAGRVVRTRQPLHGQLTASAAPLDGPFGGIRVTVRMENHTPWDGDPDNRKGAMSHSFVACHTLMAVTPAGAGTFISLLDPPEWARPAAEACTNLHTYPVMIGDPARADELFSSPIILYDYPAIAPESPGDLFDATEIDEILILRTMTLTEEEKAEARATDPKAAAIIDRVDSMAPELLDRLHGAVRYLESVTKPGRGAEPANSPPKVPAGSHSGWPADMVPELGTGADGVPVFGEYRPFGEEFQDKRPATTIWGQDGPMWDPADDPSVNPDADAVNIAGVAVRKGSKVLLKPGARRSDAQDIFLAGKVADVQAVFSDLENKQFLAVTLEDDPNADLQVEHGRFLYFSPDEVVPQ
ncbi:MAG TPA: hypothetical protein VHA57_03265 [Actinomycetota bacterium]|nr:hypothetical protein [Actinomycetota bacterium]